MYVHIYIYAYILTNIDKYILSEIIYRQNAQYRSRAKYERSERQNLDYFIEFFNHDKFVSYGTLIR